MTESIPFQFTGSIPQSYDDYLGPLFFEPYAQDIGNLIDASTINNALEISSGTGRVTRHLRKVLAPNARLVASDVSEDMLTVAKNKLAGLNIEWKIIDAQALPFEDDSFDVIVCYFGYMLVSDKVKAFKEAHRVLRKGGQLILATWDKLDTIGASHIFRMTLKQYLGDTLPESYKTPFSMHDPALIMSQLKDAGFLGVQCERVQKESVAESSSKAADGLIKGGSLYNEIARRDPALIEKITATVEKELAEKYGHAPMIAPMSALITRAIK